MLESGLSPMQERLLTSPKFVRIVSAPTGSGKSYAFVREAIENNKRILFIVPTKRLLQNLVNDACEQMSEQLRRRGLTEDKIKLQVSRSINGWSANQSAEDGRHISVDRIAQMQDVGIKIIFAIPEIVVRMISGVRIKGGTTLNPFSYVRFFDHIVFDEFHTIDDRSFGLACLLSLVAISDAGGKVTMLSATPVNITNVLQEVGISEKDVDIISEEIVDGLPVGNRPVHGEVTIVVENHRTLSETLVQNIDTALDSISDGYTVILIYDSLQRLKKEEKQLRDFFQKRGVSSEKILTINSIDDSRRQPGSLHRGHVYHDPRNYSILICTSSVELGVTFKSNLMMMEPGHNKSSFIQRIGRVSRGKNPGKIIVSLNRDRRNRHRWIKQVEVIIENNSVLDIKTFTAKVLVDFWRQFEPNISSSQNDSSVQFYRKVSWRGVYWAGLFIEAILSTKMGVQKEAKNRLKELRGRSIRKISGLVNQIKKVDVINDNVYSKGQPHKEWLNALFTSALTYRDIGATFTIVDPDGTRHNARESFIRRATTILSRYIQYEEDGEIIIELGSKTLTQEIQDHSGKIQEQMLRLYVRSPIGDRGFSVSIREHDRQSESTSIRLVEEWKLKFHHLIPKSGKKPSSPQEMVIEAATGIVELLGKPPLEEDHEDSIESAFFA